MKPPTRVRGGDSGAALLSGESGGVGEGESSVGGTGRDAGGTCLVEGGVGVLSGIGCAAKASATIL
jgi:hypothetical protein